LLVDPVATQSDEVEPAARIENVQTAVSVLTNLSINFDASETTQTFPFVASRVVDTEVDKVLNDKLVTVIAVLGIIISPYYFIYYPAV